MNQCPHCRGSLPTDAVVCPCCARRAVDWTPCPDCCEPIAKNATRCPHCGQRVPTDQDIADKNFTMQLRATRLGALFTGGGFLGLLLPSKISVGDGRVVITHWSAFGLRRHDQDIPLKRIASVRYTKGVIWGSLLIETFGGATEDLEEHGLRQKQARILADQLKSIVGDES